MMNTNTFGTYEYFYDVIRTQFESTPEPYRSTTTITTAYAALCNCIADESENIETLLINCTKAYRSLYDKYVDNNN